MSEEKTTEKQSEWRQRELGAFWKREYRNGEGTYLAGHIIEKDEYGAEKKTKVVLFSNRDKPSERAPDFKLYRSKEYKSSEDTQSSSADTEAQSSSADAKTPDDEDIL